MRTRTMLSVVLAVILLTMNMPFRAMAAPIEITATIKSSLDKTMNGTTADTADRIRSQYSGFLSLHNQEEDWDAKIKSLHSDNSKTSSALSKQIGQIDKAKIDDLKAQTASKKEQYKPLFSEYTELNKQIKAARALKDKDLSSLLRFQADLLKWPIQLARADIKIVEDEWKAARSRAAAVKKEIQTVKKGADPLKAQIKARQEAIKSIATSVTPVWNEFKAAVKKADSSSVQSSLESLVSSSRRINAEKQEIFQLEAAIHDIYEEVQAMLP